MEFDLYSRTNIFFGTGKIARLDDLVGPEERVLLLFGGGSIKRNGVHRQVMDALRGRRVVEFGGVEANPEYETILEAARLARQENCTLVLGVGGGSVIDASKFLATIAPIQAEDPWDWLREGNAPQRILRNGAVLTLPATGSESNPVSVISRHARGLKIPFAYQAARPDFAILDPSTMKSLDRRQLENGVVDAVTHVLEQYLTPAADAPLQHGYSEVLLEALFEWGPRLVEEDSDQARETVMWAANQALNGLIGSGIAQDWSTHMIGHAITALHGIDHARTLSMVMPALLRYKLDRKLPMLARYARRVWKVDEPDDRKAAVAAIERTEDFFRRMGCPISLSEFQESVIEPQPVVEHIQKAGQFPLGENRDINGEDVLRILKQAA